MDILWNDRVIASPVVITNNHKAEINQINCLKNVLHKARYIFNAKDLNTPSALISRLIARRHQSFRTQQSFQLLKKTNIALCRLKELKIVKDIEIVLDSLPKFIYTDTVDLPTRELFEYILLRLQSVAKLCLRAVICSKNAVSRFLNYIAEGFYIEISTLYLGVLSEIWVKTKELCKKSVLLYSELFPFLTIFKSHRQWLPINYVLKCEIKTFLGDDWLEYISEPIDVDNTEYKRIKITNNNNNNRKNVLKKCVPSKEPSQMLDDNSDTNNQDKRTNITAEEIGIVIDRPTITQQKLPLKLKRVITLKQIDSISKILDFLKTEDLLRLKHQTTYSVRINDKQWKCIKIKINTILVRNNKTENVCVRKIVKFLKEFIKKEKI